MYQMQSSHGLDIIRSVFGAEPAGDSALACRSSVLSLAFGPSHGRILEAVNSEAWVSSAFAMLASGLSSDLVMTCLRKSVAQALLRTTAAQTAKCERYAATCVCPSARDSRGGHKTHARDANCVHKPALTLLVHL